MTVETQEATIYQLGDQITQRINEIERFLVGLEIGKYDLFDPKGNVGLRRMGAGENRRWRLVWAPQRIVGAAVFDEPDWKPIAEASIRTRGELAEFVNAFVDAAILQHKALRPKIEEALRRYEQTCDQIAVRRAAALLDHKEQGRENEPL